jgi:hypothetical protein
LSDPGRDSGGRALVDDVQRAVVVAVAVVRVMEPSFDKMVPVITMGHQRVAAAGTMVVAPLHGRTGLGVSLADLDTALVKMVAVQMMQAPVVQVVSVLMVADCGVAASLAMNMRMVAVNTMVGHLSFRLADKPRLVQAE